MATKKLDSGETYWECKAIIRDVEEKFNDESKEHFAGDATNRLHQEVIDAKNQIRNLQDQLVAQHNRLSMFEGLLAAAKERWEEIKEKRYEKEQRKGN